MATTKGRPRRGYATIPVLVRFPATMLERIAAYHAQIASQDWRLTSRHDVILMLCERGLQTVEQGPAPFTPPLPGVAGNNGMGDTAGQASLAKARSTPPLVPAPEAAVVTTPDRQPDEHTVVQEVAGAGAGPAPRTVRRPGTMRARIVELLHEHPAGLSAEEIRVYLRPAKPLGDVLLGMRRQHVVNTRGSGKDTRYYLL
jgi:hypothetical protein